MSSITIEEAIQRLPLNVLANRLAIPAEVPNQDGKLVRCFFPDRHPKGDQNPSFNFHSGLTRYKCFACGIEGRGPDLIAAVLGLPRDEAIRRFIALAGGASEIARTHLKAKKPFNLPADLHPGTDAELRTLAALRRINPEAVALTSGLGVLRFGTVCGFPTWIVTDEARKIAEARRMDGLPFPATGTLGERKAHTLAGSDKSWPVGIRPNHSRPEAFPQIALVEGGPDLIAAYHFMIEQGECRTLAAAMLGRNCTRIHPEAVAYFKGKSVRIFPHADPDGGGIEAAKRWKRELLAAGAAKVDAFTFDGLTCLNGKSANDLNDCTVLRPEDQPAMGGLFQ